MQFFARAPANTTRPFDVFTAQLSNGSFGQSSLVVRFPHALDRELPREAFPTVPYPVRAGEYAFFGVAFANGGEALVVRQVDVEVPGGYDFARNGGRGVELFADAPLEAVEPSAGWSRVDARHVRWRGNVSLDPSEAAWWGVGVRITEDPAQSTSIEGASGNATATTLRFGNGYADASTLWSGSPGILRHRVPPAREGAVGYAGGVADVGRALPLEASVSAYRTQVSQAWSYDVTPGARLLQLQNGLTNASLQVLDRRAPLGSVVEAEVDVQSLVTTLAGQGVADAALHVGVYAPPSMGCHPTASWRVPASSMPRAEVTALELWDAAPGVGSAYLGAGDGRAYRVEATGSPLWTREVGARPSALLPLPDGALLVGDESGAVHRIDAATGLPAWSSRVARLAVTTLAHDAATDRVVAGAFDGRLALLGAGDGAVLASFQGASGMAYSGAAFAPDGAVLAINGSLHVERFDSDLARVAASPAGAYLALAQGPGILLAATATGWVELDAGTLALVARHDSASSVLHASAGDVDGDGAEDLALALEDLTLVLVDGATRGEASWTPQAPLSTTRLGPGAVLGPVGAATCALANEASATYRDAPLCTFHERNKPYAVRIQDGRVAYAYAQAGQPHACLHDDGLARVWCRGMDPRLVPTRLAVGAFGGGRGVAIATADGTLEVREDAGGNVLLATSPTQAVGRLAIRAPVPMGGFFGAHLLVANVEWTDALGKPHAVGLADWFHVVDVDGTPVNAPVYRVVMVGRDRAEPGRGP